MSGISPPSDTSGASVIVQALSTPPCGFKLLRRLSQTKDAYVAFVRTAHPSQIDTSFSQKNAPRLLCLFLTDLTTQGRGSRPGQRRTWDELDDVRCHIRHMADQCLKPRPIGDQLWNIRVQIEMHFDALCALYNPGRLNFKQRVLRDQDEDIEIANAIVEGFLMGLKCDQSRAMGRTGLPADAEEGDGPPDWSVLKMFWRF